MVKKLKSNIKQKKNCKLYSKIEEKTNNKNEIVKSIKSVKVGDVINLKVTDGVIFSQVKEVQEEKD